MERHLKDLLSALNAHEVRYVVVGSYALAVHAQTRATGDLDVLVDTAPEQEFTPKDFEDPTTIFQVGVSPIRIDIIKRISGLDFETVWASSVPWVIDDEVPARYISQEHFIQNKLAVGRLQDLADVSAVMQSNAALKKRASN
jgi:hypothetical protein